MPIPMKRWFLLLLVCSALGASNPARWKINLEQSQGLKRFDREVSALWMTQQGVLFLTPEQVLVYQVNRAAPQARLAPRDASGGAGNFLLNIKVLSVQDGHLIKSLDLPTNGAFSNVLATGTGGFVARTGATLGLYSADFHLIASRELPLARDAPFEDWQLEVSPSGASVVLVHERVFTPAEVLSDNTVLHDGKAIVDVELLDPETLRPKKAFVLSHILPFWTLADDVLFTSNPAHSYSDGQVGRLDFDGNWSPIRADSPFPKSSCPYSLSAIDEHRFVLYGCEAFVVLSAGGKRVFSHDDGRFEFRSVAAGGPYLAVACDHYRVGKDTLDSSSVLTTRADRIEVYDLEKHARLLSIPVHSERAFYAISAQGDLVVVDGANLEVVHAGH
jgi:hypothetical protein